MINNISEGALRVASKIDPSGAVHDKEVLQQKAREMSEARPVEASEAGGQAQKKDTQPKDQGTSRYLLADRQMVFEKYDRNGDLILRIPPSMNPVDEKV